MQRFSVVFWGIVAVWLVGGIAARVLPFTTLVFVLLPGGGVGLLIGLYLRGAWRFAVKQAPSLFAVAGLLLPTMLSMLPWLVGAGAPFSLFASTALLGLPMGAWPGRPGRHEPVPIPTVELDSHGVDVELTHRSTVALTLLITAPVWVVAAGVASPVAGLAALALVAACAMAVRPTVHELSVRGSDLRVGEHRLRLGRGFFAEVVDVRGTPTLELTSGEHCVRLPVAGHPPGQVAWVAETLREIGHEPLRETPAVPPELARIRAARNHEARHS